MFSLLVLLGGLIVGADAAADWQVRTLGGETVVGELTRLDRAGLTLSTPAGERHWPLDELLSAGPRTPPTPRSSEAGWLAEFAGGSRFACGEVTGDETTLHFRRADGALVDLPRQALRQLRRHPPTPESEAIWARLAEAPRAADVLVVRQGTEFDFIEGVIGAITPSGLTFVLDGDALQVKWTKIEGCRLFGVADAENAPPPVVLRDLFESELRLEQVNIEGGQLTGTWAPSATVSLPLAAVRELVSAGGRVQSLVASTPESEVWTPFFGTSPPAELRAWYGPRRVAAGAESQLELGGARYREGLVLHSRTRLVYRLNKGANRFQAIVGLSDRVRPAGHVRLRITADGQSLFDEDVDGHSSPRSVDLPLAGAARLEIVVDFGAGLDLADELVLAEPRILE